MLCVEMMGRLSLNARLGAYITGGVRKNYGEDENDVTVVTKRSDIYVHYRWIYSIPPEIS